MLFENHVFEFGFSLKSQHFNNKDTLILTLLPAITIHGT